MAIQFITTLSKRWISSTRLLLPTGQIAERDPLLARTALPLLVLVAPRVPAHPTAAQRRRVDGNAGGLPAIVLRKHAEAEVVVPLIQQTEVVMTANCSRHEENSNKPPPRRATGQLVSSLK